jgi:hypothetical protein
LYCLNRREKKTSPKRQGLVGNSFFVCMCVCITNRERRSGRQFVRPIRLMLWLNAYMLNIRSGEKKNVDGPEWTIQTQRSFTLGSISNRIVWIPRRSALIHHLGSDIPKVANVFINRCIQTIRTAVGLFLA